MLPKARNMAKCHALLKLGETIQGRLTGTTLYKWTKKNTFYTLKFANDKIFNERKICRLNKMLKVFCPKRVDRCIGQYTFHEARIGCPGFKIIRMNYMSFSYASRGFFFFFFFFFT